MNKRILLLSIFALLMNRSAAQVSKTGKQVVSLPVTIGVAEELLSKQLSEKRLLNIYLPEGYNKADTARYPVIYLLDGGVDEDFIHVAGLVQFNTLAWVNRIPKSIVVGIVNVDRKRDFTYPTTIESEKKLYPATGGSGAFIAFIEKELQPYIAQQYKTNGVRTIIGQSLGGLLATEILFRKPGLFDKYIIISPSLWWDNGSLLQWPMNKSLARKTAVYIGVGKEGLAPSAVPHVMEVDANVLGQKMKDAGFNVQFDYLPEENHATITHQAIFNAFRMLYPVTEPK